MKARMTSLVVLLGFVSISLPAAGYKIKTQSGSCPDGVPWSSQDLPYEYHIHEDGSDDLSFSKVKQGHTESFTEWDTPCCSSFTGTYKSKTSDVPEAGATFGNTQKNIMYFEKNDWPQALGDKDTTFAVTQSTYVSCNTVDADIFYNGVKWTWNMSGSFQGDDADLQSVATHEIGHVAGLGHTDDTSATMYPKASSDKIRSTELDDWQGICSIYSGSCICTPAKEVCDDIDNDCDTETDEGLTCHPPTLNEIADPAAIDEDSDAQSMELTGISAGEDGSPPISVSAQSKNTAIVGAPSVSYSSPSSTGTLTYKPVANANGTAEIEATVRESGGLTTTRSFQVTVQPVNDPPTIDPISDVNIQEDAQKTTLPISGVSPGPKESQDLNISASSDNQSLIESPTVKYTNPDSTGSLFFTPKPDANGDATITVSVDDGADENPTTSRSFNVTVEPVNDPPVFVPPTPDSTLSTEESERLQFQVQATDIDDSDLTYSISPEPSGATFDETTGLFRWTPTWEQADTYTFTLGASDGKAEQTRDVTVKVTFIDTDSDGVPDTWEKTNGLDTSSLDSDGDTISDEDEIGGSPLNAPDTDGDGTIDALDKDSDGDGIPDQKEAGDDDLSTPPVDTDDDGTADFRSLDADGDTVKDGEDNCRLIANQQQRDIDENGVGDACDEDIDGDSLDNSLEEKLGLDPEDRDSDGDTIKDKTEVGDSPEEPIDTDSDGTIDALSDDSDGDGHSDKVEAGDDKLATPPVDTDSDGTPDFRDTDSDGDTIPDAEDNCRLVKNPEQVDTDDDGKGDACDGDIDGDGVDDGEDNCKSVANETQVDTDGDGKGDKCDSDMDGDSIPNEEDNCPLEPNEEQKDNDDDEIGNICDKDDDDDGIRDNEDNCPLTENEAQEDTDDDGKGDACDSDLDGDGADNEDDNCPDVSNEAQEDTDGDGEGNVCDETPGTDIPGGCGCSSSGHPVKPGLVLFLILLVGLRARSTAGLFKSEANH